MSCAITIQLICALVFAYAKIRFSHDVAQIMLHSSAAVNVDESSICHLLHF